MIYHDFLLKNELLKNNYSMIFHEFLSKRKYEKKKSTRILNILPLIKYIYI